MVCRYKSASTINGEREREWEGKSQNSQYHYILYQNTGKEKEFARKRETVEE